MTQTGYSNAIVNIMLGWLKGLAGWVLKLFNLAGSGGNPLLWLSENWLKLLIVLLILGMGIDWLVWMIRWRPYWVWFRKKRIIVNDEKFLEDDMFAEDDDSDVMDQRYVVPSTMVKRREPAPRKPKKEGMVEYVRPHSGEERKRIEPNQISNDIFSDDLFEVGRDQPDCSDFYEDEVFNVSNLPKRPENKRGKKRRGHK